MKRFRFKLLSLMIIVAMIALAAWGYALRRRDAELVSTLRRRDAELASALKRLSAQFASKADHHHKKIFELYRFGLPHGMSFAGDLIPVFRAVDETPQESERHLRYLEDFYGPGLTESDLARRDLTRRGQAELMLHLLWLRYEVHMYFKYRHAATRPWLPVAPDPPVPPLGPYPPRDDEWWRDRELQAKITEYRKAFPNIVPE